MWETVIMTTAVAVAGLILLWVAYLFIGDFSGAPFVPVADAVLNEILIRMKMEKGSEFWDLGSGNGKAVFAAALKYGVKAKGAEINPFLIAYCRLKARILKLKDVTFVRGNIFQCDLSGARYIYFYLYMGTVEKAAQKIEKECRPGTVVVSRAFEIKRWKSKLTYTLETKGWVTFFYKV